MLLFQSTRSRGARRLYQFFRVSCSKFQSTRSRGARPERRKHRLIYLLFQSTRSRGARRPAIWGRVLCCPVSIHALTWSATPSPPSPPSPPSVSIHALTWSATLSQNTHEKYQSEFQSTRSRGARRCDKLHGCDWAKVSIHALTWSATIVVGLKLLIFFSFNPRAHVERDLCVVAVYTELSTVFQSTRSRGARLPLIMPVNMKFGFQSTRSRGARHMHIHHQATALSEFQSTRSRGARLVFCFPRGAYRYVSIHALTWSAT